MHRKIKDNVYWTGAVDWDVRNFHGYTTRFGTTYNSYLVQDEKVALIDTVKEGFEDKLLDKLEHIGVEKLDYLIVNHIEMDHAGSLEKILEEFPEAQVVTNKRAERGLKDAYGLELDDPIIVDTGDELSLGDKTLTFLKTTMVHWPDSMVTYLPEDEILFSNDAFGLHYASEKRFDTEFDDDEMGRIFYETAKYYANIVLPYSNVVQNVLGKIEDMGLTFDVIAPSHGIIWKENVSEILERYDSWSSHDAEDKVIVVYDSMWGHTADAADKVIEGIEREDVDYRVYDLGSSDETEIMTEIMLSRGVVVGSPTLNGEIFPSIAGFLTYMKGLEPKDKVSAAFGSYGWSGEASGKILDYFKELDFDVVGSEKWVFDAKDEDLADLSELGEEVASKISQ